MRDHLVSTANFASWPEPRWDNEEDNEPPPDGQERGRAAAAAKITSAMSDSRRLFLISGGLLTADVTGAAVAVSAFLSHGHSVALWAAGLLVPVILSWFIAALLMTLGEQAVAGSLGELRRVTGAPVDLSAPWRSLGVTPMAESDIAWEHIVLLIGAATLHHARSRLALSWAIITTVGFMLWLALSLAMAAVS
jgi:hypothetical protein